MSVPPDTRNSLLARLADVGDDDAWREFASLYEPFIYRQARRYGLQHADACELVQEVLIAVSKALKRFTVDRDRGRFRTWLYAIGRNISLRHLARVRPADRATGDSHVRAAIAQVPDPCSVESHEFDTELKRHAFLWVANEVRGEFEPRTWQAFWSTTVENHSIRNAASSLGMSVGAVYIARSRVMGRLRTRIQEITLDGIPEALEVLEWTVSEEVTA